MPSQSASEFVIRDDRGKYYMGQDLEGHWFGPSIEHAGIYTEQDVAVEEAGRLTIDLNGCGIDVVCEAVPRG